MIDVRYSREHVWLRLDDDGCVTLGISEYAQEQLGDIVYIELPETGRELGQGEEVGAIESVKTTGELISPIGGRVVETNAALADAPELINDSPLDDGWILRLELEDAGALDELMDEDSYLSYLESLG